MGNIKVRYSSAFAVVALMIMLLLPSPAMAGRGDVNNDLSDANGQLLAQAYDNDRSSIDEESSYDYDAEKEWQETTPSGNSSGDDDSFSDGSLGSKFKKLVPVICGSIGVLVLVVGFFLIIALATRKKGSGSSAPLWLGCGCCTFIAFVVIAVFAVFLFYNFRSSDDGDEVKPGREMVERGTTDTGTGETGESGDIASNRDPNDPDYTPARYAIKAGSDGGRWDVMQSGETIYEYPESGEVARAVWIEDGGKYYYVDASGCKMIGNYAHDGFFAGGDGSWDQSKEPIKENLVPKSGMAYSDGSTRWVFHLDASQNGTISGTATQTYSNGNSETYRVTSFGHSAYRLIYTKDEQAQAHVVVVMGGNSIVISCGGTTDGYYLEGQ